jgi:hypothetical protein
MVWRPLRATSGVTLAAVGMGVLCFGFKAAALTLFGIGVSQIEQDWRARHPEFRGGVGARWRSALDFYRRTHEHPTNRVLHMIGIPLIVGGALGLLLSPPLAPFLGAVWLGSLAAFGTGWLLNLVGHVAYEKRAPAFSEDALSFLAGPVWDLQQVLNRTFFRRTA